MFGGEWRVKAKVKLPSWVGIILQVWKSLAIFCEFWRENPGFENSQICFREPLEWPIFPAVGAWLLLSISPLLIMIFFNCWLSQPWCQHQAPLCHDPSFLASFLFWFDFCWHYHNFTHILVVAVFRSLQVASLSFSTFSKQFLHQFFCLSWVWGYATSSEVLFQESWWPWSRDLDTMVIGKLDWICWCVPVGFRGAKSCCRCVYFSTSLIPL